MNGDMQEKGSVIVAVDLGTTSAKALAIRSDKLLTASQGETEPLIAFRSEAEYPLLNPQPGWAEQDPELIAASAARAVREAVMQAKNAGCRVVALTFSSAMHSLIALNGDGKPLIPSITWADLRAADYARAIRESELGAQLTSLTGVPVHAMTPFSKLLWMKGERPELFAAAHRFVGIKEFVLERWFGRACPMDESVAGGTGFYGLRSRQWEEAPLRLAGIRAEQLPELAPSTAVLRGLLPDISAQLALPEHTPVIIGAADGVLANLGGGALAPGVVGLTVGTSGAVRAAVSKPEADPQGRLFCYPLADSIWIAGGSVNSGGVVYQWLREELAPDLTERHGGAPGLVDYAMEAPIGAGGLLFLPYLSGERAPHWDEQARGVYFGLSLQHDRKHMVRAGLEGIVLGLRSVLEALAELIGKPTEIRVSGGFVRSEPLRQLMADIFGCDVVLTDSEDSSAIGAARLALRALGAGPDLYEAAAQANVTKRNVPDRERAARYDELYQQFTNLYNQLKESFGGLQLLR